MYVESTCEFFQDLHWIRSDKFQAKFHLESYISSPKNDTNFALKLTQPLIRILGPVDTKMCILSAQNVSSR